MHARLHLVLGILGSIFIISGSAGANSVSLIWQGSGTATTVAAASSTITADLVVSITTSPGISALVFNIAWDMDADDELDYVAAACAPWGAVNLCLLGQGDTAGNPGLEAAWGASGGAGGVSFPTGTFTAGTITFHVTSNVSSDGIDVEPTFLGTGPEEVVGAGCFGAACGSLVLTGASVNVVPEPGSLALLALGLVGAGLLRRRS